MFEPGKRYPSDDVGEHVDLEGVVTFADDSDMDEQKVIVQTTTHGEQTGWTYPNVKPPPVGAVATIRCYRCGGGWYPDDRIVSWRAA